MPEFRVKLRRSSTSGSAPSTSDLELGELAINTHDGKLFTKKDDGTESIIEVGRGTDLAWTASTRTISSSTGTNAIISNATTTNSGLMSSSDKTKLNNIEAGAEVNVGTDLSYVSSTREVQSSTGTNAVLPEVIAGGISGFITGSDKTKLDGIDSGAQVNVGTDLSYTSATRALASSTGTDVTLPLVVAGGTDGLMSGTDKTKLNSIQSNAQINVQSDWNATTGDALILNKPSIPQDLDDLSNVDSTSPTDGQVLTWDNTNSYWTPTNANDGVTNLSYDGQTRVIASSTGTNATLPEVGATGNSGLMTSSDKSKLDGIEASATADQTDAEIKTAYENNSNTNAFTDAEKTKLGGIATGAEVNVQSDWDATSGDSLILNKPTIYAEPGIFSGGGTPTLASGVTGAEIRSLIGAGVSDFSGSYIDLTNKPTIYAEPGIFSGGGTPTLATGVTAAEIRTLIGAGTSSFDGAYSSLTGTPTIPTNNNQLTNGAGYTTFDGDYNSLTNLPTIPTNNNQLTNGAGYITSFDITTQTDSKYARSDANDTITGNLEFTSVTEPIKTRSILFVNSEGDGTYYTDQSGVLAFDENFHSDTDYGTGTYAPDSVFTGGDGGGLLVKNSDGWGAIYSTTNTRWAEAEWAGLKVGANRVLTVADEGTGNGLDADLLDGQEGSFYQNASNLNAGLIPSARINNISNATATLINLENDDDPEFRFIEENTDTTAKLVLSGGDFYIQAGASGSGTGTSSGDIRFTGYNDANINAFTVKTGGSDNTIWHAGNDGSGSGLDADTVDGQHGSYYLDYNNFTNTPSFTGSFDSLTDKTSGTGNYSTTGDIVSGRGSGGVALTINDGKGNANVTFNHQDGTPEQNGNAARIEVNCDSTSNANINFEAKSNVTGGTNVGLTSIFNMSETGATCLGNTVWHAGNDGSGSGLDADTVDGFEASSFLRSDADDAASGQIKINDGSANPLELERSSQVGIEFNDTSVGSRYLGVNSGDLYYGSNLNHGTNSKVWHAGNDGSGSGLDADKVDGYQASDFLLRNAGTDLTMNGYSLHFGAFNTNSKIRWSGTTSVWDLQTGDLQFRDNTTTRFTFSRTTGNFAATGSITAGGNTVWHSGNDGSGSGLDADLLDGQEGSYYQNASNLNAGTIPDARISDIGDSEARIITFDNLEKGNLTSDGQLSFDSSQGLILYRTQQGVNTAVTVLDGANVNAGANISINNIDAGTTGTGAITFAVIQGPGSNLDADTLDNQEGSYYTNASNISSGTIDTARLPATYTKASAVTIQATGVGNDLRLDAADHIILESGEEEDGNIYFRGNGGTDSYRFAKSGQSTIEGFLSFQSLTADRTYTFPDAGGTIALTSDLTGSFGDATTLDGIDSTSFLRSDASDDVSGHTEWQDFFHVRLGNGADMRMYHDGSDNYFDSYNGHIYIRNNVDNDAGDNIYIQAKSGEHSIICNDDGSVQLYNNGTQCLQTLSGGDVKCFRHFLPDVTASNDLGSSSLKWNELHAVHWLYAQSVKTYGLDRFVLGHDGFGNNSGTNSWAQFIVEDTGEIIFGKDFADWGIAGGQFELKGARQIFTTGTGHLWRTNTTNGVIVSFYSNATFAGQIQLNSATVVAYVGGHLSRYSQFLNDERPEVVLGTVLSNLDEMCEWSFNESPDLFYEEGDILPEGKAVGDLKAIGVKEEEAGIEDNLQLNRVKISDVVGDKNVTGIFSQYEDDDPNDPHARKYDKYDDFTIAQSGDYVIRIGKDTVIERGDLLMSAGDGTAMPQDDDIVRSCTIAKVNSTSVRKVYPDGSYLVPCTLML